jgi:nucleoside-diphosphate-sugar epimerase
MKKICITGGGGYVGTMLAQHLANLNYDVTILDTFWYGLEVFKDFIGPDKLKCITGDIRYQEDLKKAFEGQDAVIHLACISNDPSFEMNPHLGKSINFDCFPQILKEARAAGVKRFLYASSSSVYGVSEMKEVTEDAPCKPLTDYSMFKLMCEETLRKYDFGQVEWAIVRPATVCGWSPRLRLDLTVNIMTINALVDKKMLVFGGSQLRPNIHVRDMARAYSALLSAPTAQMNKQTYNVGFENKSVLDIAKLVKRIVGGEIIIDGGAVDQRSYHVNSDKIEYELGFRPESTIESAVRSIQLAYDQLKIPRPMTDPKYRNIQRMKQIGLT